MEHSTQNYGEGKLTRRTVLRGAGVTLALPYLTATTSANAKDANAKSPRRFVAMSLGLGLLSANLNPKEPGRNYKPSPYLKALMDIRKQFTVISGTDSSAAAPASCTSNIRLLVYTE